MVSLEDGSLDLRRILVPIDAVPDATPALTRATRAAAALGDPPVAITLLHVGDSAPPTLDLPTGDAWTWKSAQRSGDPAEEIADASQDADLVVMATDGRDGFLDIFRGSVTERVVRHATCPVLAVPVL
jgi:nucleotide-binding universal stress UspA family protein